jgi:hypothetical protein
LQQHRKCIDREVGCQQVGHVKRAEQIRLEQQTQG